MINRRQAVRQFREHWMFRRGSEKGEDQQFWNSLLRDVLGMADVESRVQYQVPVPMAGTTKFLDAWIPETRVLIEHKSRGVDLDAPQAGHDGKTPYEQALEYDNARPYGEKSRWIVVCNFDEIRVHDMERPLAPPQRIRLSDLPREVSRLEFLVDSAVKSVREKEKDISIKAGRIVGELYGELRRRYADPDSPETLKHLNRLCVRLVFLFYAEDADIFPKDAFWNLLKETPSKFLRKRLIELFLTLDAPLKSRDPYLEPELAAFPYTNGGLFRGISDAEIPPLDDEIKDLLVRSADFDWRDISPTIFGALFESTLNPVTRRAGGMVYTSVENIHKVIDPLFLGGLRADLAAIEENAKLKIENVKLWRRQLLALQAKLASLTFLDPACGSGNFLTETYICLRRLENRIIAALQQGQGELWLDDGRADLRVGRDDDGRADLRVGRGPDEAGPSHVAVKVSIAQFHGIEINDFAVAVARTALWIAEAQMLRETADILHREPDYLPLRDYGGIVEGNALRLDWSSLGANAECRMQNAECEASDNSAFSIQHSAFSFIIGNPPFVGHQYRTREQAADMDAVYADWKDTNYGKLDYVCAWYKKAADYIRDQGAGIRDQGTLTTGHWPLTTKCAFVSTNSICQGESVAAMWKPLFERAGVEIDFAHRTFRWDNEASEKAHVHCVIVGFHCLTPSPPSSQSGEEETSRTSRTLRESKIIFDGGKAIPATHIDGYLIDAPDVFIENRGRPRHGAALPSMSKGSQPTDGGNLILSPDERDEILAKWPDAASFILRYIGSDDFINNVVRYCLWLKDVAPNLYRHIPPVMERLARVAEMRRKSPTASVRRDAETPMLFTQIRQPATDYLVIPKVSSERRKYIPIGYLTPEVIANDMLCIIPEASPYMFGVLTSSVHMAWMRVVAGRLEMRYRYTPAVYNNFPWPLPPAAAVEGRRSKVNQPSSRNLQDLRPSDLGPSMTAIAATAQAILDARARYPDSSLADLYDPLTMPPDLRAAHAANDKAVLAAYGLTPDTPEPEIVAHLFKLYAEVTEVLSKESTT